MENPETLYSYKLKSHPEKLLIEHLEHVYTLMLNEFKAKRLNIGTFETEIETIIKLTALCHDFGKSTKYFQSYLSKELNSSNKTNHSYLSALFCLYISEEIGISKSNILLPYIVVNKHHGNFRNFSDEVIDKYYYELQDQLKNIDIKEINSIYQRLLNDFEIKIDFDLFKSKIDEGSDFIESPYFLADNVQKNIESFFVVEFLFSLLIDSDKLDAGINDLEKIKAIKNKIYTFSLPCAVEEHKKTLDHSAMNTIREAIYTETIGFCDNLDTNNKIYSLNVPTGTGKTLTSLSFALKLKDKLLQEDGFNPKIIYCLPFTSIIDQNYDVIKKVLEHNNVQTTTETLLKHHHLSEVSYSTNFTENECDQFDTNKSLLLIESWMSSIVVTTFVQFFHSLISNKNRSLKKFHNIANSIVILDEVQAVPHKYWHLINVALKTFSKMFNTYFILVTATQPLIFNEATSEIVPIIKNKEKYFKHKDLNRINLSVSKEKISLEDFQNNLMEELQREYQEKSALIILNTIKSSQAVYSFLKENINDENIDILYLSTTIMPCDRLEIIKKVKDRKNNKRRIILVSTQVVEAGVDIDLDIVYRDIAPLDCIFQSAGRCNRNAGETKGLVKIIKLIDDKNQKPYSSYVYQNVLLDCTEKVLSEFNELSENEFIDLANKYYEKLTHIKSDKDSRDIIKFMEALEFEKIKEFQIIDQKGLEPFDFFVEVDNDACIILKQFEDILYIQDPLERKNRKLDIKKEFYQFVVSIRLNKAQKDYFLSDSRYEIIKDSLYKIPFNELEDFYERVGIGFNLNNIEKLKSTELII